MPVPAKSFYPRDDKSCESESRWPECHFKSDIVIPPSEISEPLSAPTSGFSVPKTTSSGLKAPTRTLGVRPVLQTRFVKALVKQQDRWQSCAPSAPSAQQVLTNVKEPGQPLTLPSDNLNDNEKCMQWVESHSITGSKAASTSKFTVTLKPLVDYSPSASSLSSRSSLISKERVSRRLQLGDMEKNVPSINTPCVTSVQDIPQSLTNYRKTATVLVGPQPTSDMRDLEEFLNDKATELGIVPSGSIAVVKIQYSLVQELSYDVEFLNVDVATQMAELEDLILNGEIIIMAQERVDDNFVEFEDETISNLAESGNQAEAIHTPSKTAIKRKCDADSGTKTKKQKLSHEEGHDKMIDEENHQNTLSKTPVNGKSLNENCSSDTSMKQMKESNSRNVLQSTENIRGKGNSTAGTHALSLSKRTHPPKAEGKKNLQPTKRSSCSRTPDVNSKRPKFTPTSPKAVERNKKEATPSRRASSRTPDASKQSPNSLDQFRFAKKTPQRSNKVAIPSRRASSITTDASKQSPNILDQSQFPQKTPQTDDASSHQLSPYQLLRQKNLAENRAHFESVLKQPVSGTASKTCAGTMSTLKLPKKNSDPKHRPRSQEIKKSATVDLKVRPERRCRNVARQLIQQSSLSSDESESDASNNGSGDWCKVLDEEDSNSSGSEDDSSTCQQVNKPNTSNNHRSSLDSSASQQVINENDEEERTENDEEERTENDEEERLENDEEERLLNDEEEETDDEEEETDDEEDSHDDEENNDDDTTAPPKSSSKAAKAMRRQLRNVGKAYTTPQGKPIKARSWKPPHECQVRKCHEVITPEIGDVLFQEYWEQASFDKRVAYVAARCEKSDVKRKRGREADSIREKSQSIKYFFDIDGERVQVCRSTFISTLGETDRFVRGVFQNKRKSRSGIAADDRRGKHVPKHALTDERKNEVIDHINSFPAYVSHYCRAKTQSLYLSSDLNVTKMYNLYREEANEPVSYNTYLKEFNKTNKKFHPPKSDGCDTCDKADIAISGASNEEAKALLQADKERHVRRAEQAYELKRVAKKSAEKSNGSELVLVMDLQQCLPTPYLKCKRIYYSRQLYVFNFTIYDTVTGLTHCYMWDEVEGKRGGNEMASCLFKHIKQNVPDGVKKLTIFSDCCSGQNRNNIMCMMLIAAQQEHPSLLTIDHIFLIPGHTFMPEVDGKHAVIEKYKRNCLSRVDVPSGWYAAVVAAGNKNCENRFKVVRMTEFLDFAALAKGVLIKRDKCIDKRPFRYMETQWFRYEKNALGIVLGRSSYAEGSPFLSLSFLRRGMRCDRVPQLVSHLSTICGPFPISLKKKKDLLELLPYLPQEHHAFYEALPDSKEVLDVAPDIVAFNRGRIEVCENDCCNGDNVAEEDED